MGGYSTDWSTSRSYDWSKDKKVTGKSARDYARDDKRNYEGSSSNGIPPPKGKNITAKGPLAALLVVDVTGSMKEWPSLIFEKIATLYNEANVALQGLDPDELAKGKKKAKQLLEMAVIAVGDARGDKHPIQVVNFSKGPNLVKGVNKIYPEGNGGGNAKESYDLALYYILNHCETPNIPKGYKPPLIIAGDEGFYDKISKKEVKDLIGDTISKELSTKNMIKNLLKKYDAYILRPELSYSSYEYDRIREQWQDVLGPQRVMLMTDPKRLVDCIIGICAYSANNFNIGEKLLERRQTPDQVKEVMEILHPMLSSKKSKKEGE